MGDSTWLSPDTGRETGQRGLPERRTAFAAHDELWTLDLDVFEPELEGNLVWICSQYLRSENAIAFDQVLEPAAVDDVLFDDLTGLVGFHAMVDDGVPAGRGHEAHHGHALGR